MLQDKVETKIIDLSVYSSPTNFEWRNYASSNEIPVSVPTNISLIFYGYCGFYQQDAIALDNISLDVAINPITTPSTGPTSSVATDTTTEMTTPSTTPTSTTETSTPSTETSTPSTTTESTTETSTETTSTTTPSTTTVFVCSFKYTAVTGTISSPNFPNNYDRTSDCTYTVDVSPLPRTLNLTFTAFNTAAQDYVTVYDGLIEDINSLIFRASGPDVPAPVLTSGNKCIITFVAKSLVPSTGWSLTYTSN